MYCTALIHKFQNTSFILLATLAHLRTYGCQFQQEVLNLFLPVCCDSLLKTFLTCIFLYCLLHYFLLQIVNYLIFLRDRASRRLVLLQFWVNFNILGLSFWFKFKKWQVWVTHASYHDPSPCTLHGRLDFFGQILRWTRFADLIQFDLVRSKIFHIFIIMLINSILYYKQNPHNF